ncbi:MAG TPA: toprim domain-containing protein [Verrucomicrobiae bacterium]|nr:toprim domain-containing protein [Verrucomicrobiae bacterium]
MSKKSFIDFKAVKAAISMEQVLEHYNLLDTMSGLGKESLSGCCPIHKGSNKTQFRVNTVKNIWNCFGKCKGGNALDFIAKYENVSIHAAALKAIEWFGLDMEQMSVKSDDDEKLESKPSLKPEPKSPAVKKETVESEKASPNVPLKFRLDKLEREHPYLIKERGLTLETIIDFGIGYCAKGIMENRIAIPIHNLKGELLAYAGRWLGEPPEGTHKYKLPPGFKKSLEVFNIDRAIKETGPLIIVEGFFDCMKLHQNGWKKVVALMGSTMSPAQEELIRSQTSENSHIIVMLDENEAGRTGRDDIAQRLSKHCYVKIYEFNQEDFEPEHLFPEDLQALSEGVE